MKNAYMPAMPIFSNEAKPCIVKDRDTGKELATAGLTKREVFAMHAPECPEWYLSKFVSDNCQVEANGLYEVNYKFFTDCMTLNFSGQMQLLKQWRYAYADLMLGEDE